MPKRSKSQEQLEFEITFYERLIAKDPDFADALIPLGDAYTRLGRHEQGLAVDRRLAKLRPEDPLIWYNLACSYSLLKRVDEGLEALRKAFTLGYRDIEYLHHDPDLVNLRRSPDYHRLLETLTTSRKPS